MHILTELHQEYLLYLQSEEVLSEGLHADKIQCHDHGGGVVGAIVVQGRLTCNSNPQTLYEEEYFNDFGMTRMNA